MHSMSAINDKEIQGPEYTNQTREDLMRGSASKSSPPYFHVAAENAGDHACFSLDNRASGVFDLPL